MWTIGAESPGKLIGTRTAFLLVCASEETEVLFCLDHFNGIKIHNAYISILKLLTSILQFICVLFLTDFKKKKRFLMRFFVCHISRLLILLFWRLASHSLEFVFVENIFIKKMVIRIFPNVNHVSLWRRTVKPGKHVTQLAI